MPTHSVLPEDEVRLRVQQSIEAGRLPLLRPEQIHAGYGTDNTCCACEQRIAPAKIEYEVIAPDRLRKLMFHFACYVIWQRECSLRMRDPTARAGSSGQEKPVARGKLPSSARYEIDPLAGLGLESC